MDLDDFLEPEVGIAVVVTAALAAPPVRKALRRGAVYGLAGLMIAGDRIAALARSVAESARQPAADRDTGREPSAPAVSRSEGVPA